MKKLSQLILLTCFMASCQSEVKNSKAEVVVENGTEVVVEDEALKETETKQEDASNDLLGFWVGYFERDDKGEEDSDKILYVDEAYIWTRENKINISIDEIKDSIVTGHSVVAGNDRPFSGLVKKQNDTYSFRVKEPGDDKYDGEFTFTIADGVLQGKWTAYRNIDIKNRKYTLKKRAFDYNAEVMLEESKAYVNWNESLETKEKFEVGENEFEEWVYTEFATATNLIYEINASNKILSRSEVENLRKGDLTIIRNTIYARHGYSFKNRPLRVFFDAQSWYIPVHTNIKKDFTEIEKQNIQLLLRYEKNASEYYDSFGRG